MDSNKGKWLVTCKVSENGLTVGTKYNVQGVFHREAGLFFGIAQDDNGVYTECNSNIFNKQFLFLAETAFTLIYEDIQSNSLVTLSKNVGLTADVIQEYERDYESKLLSVLNSKDLAWYLTPSVHTNSIVAKITSYISSPIDLELLSIKGVSTIDIVSEDVEIVKRCSKYFTQRLALYSKAKSIVYYRNIAFKLFALRDDYVLVECIKDISQLATN